MARSTPAQNDRGPANRTWRSPPVEWLSALTFVIRPWIRRCGRAGQVPRRATVPCDHPAVPFPEVRKWCETVRSSGFVRVSPLTALPDEAGAPPRCVGTGAFCRVRRPLTAPPDAADRTARPLVNRARIDRIRVAAQGFGGNLAAMVLPNIGAFIAWGLLTALFTP